VEAKQPEGARTVKVEHPQIVGFGQIRGHNVKVPAVSLLGERYRDLIGEKFFDSFGGELSEQPRIFDRGIGGQDHQGATTRKQKEHIHNRILARPLWFQNSAISDRDPIALMGRGARGRCASKVALGLRDFVVAVPYLPLGN